MWRIIVGRLWGWFLSLLWFFGWIIWAYFIRPNLWVVVLALLGLLVTCLGSVYLTYRLLRRWYQSRKSRKGKTILVEEVEP